MALAPWIAPAVMATYIHNVGVRLLLEDPVRVPAYLSGPVAPPSAEDEDAPLVA